jgi:hypothetical protein
MFTLYSGLMRLAQPLLRRKMARRAVQEPGYGEAVEERFGSYTQPRETAPALVEMIRWWDATVEPVNPGETGSYSYRPIRGYSQLSNHASGTAIDINSSRHPLSARGTVSSALAVAISAKAKSLGLRWGGNYKNRADEMHFEINTPPPAAAVAASEAVWRSKYGAGRIS